MANSYNNINSISKTTSGNIEIVCEERILSRRFFNKIAKNELFTIEDFDGFTYQDSMHNLDPFTIQKIIIKYIPVNSWHYIINAFTTNTTIIDIDIHTIYDSFEMCYTFLQIINYNKTIKKLSINMPILIDNAQYVVQAMQKNKTIEELNIVIDNNINLTTKAIAKKEQYEYQIYKLIERNIKINNLDKIMEQFILAINRKKLFLPEDILISIGNICFNMY